MVTGWQVGKHVNLESLSHGYRMAGRRTCKPGEYISWLQDWKVGEHVNLESISHDYRMAGRRTCKPGKFISW